MMKQSSQSPKPEDSRWLRYSQTILQKVSFDKDIFRKELRKALKRLSPVERKDLEAWCINSFNLPLALIAIQMIQEYG